MNIEAAPGRSSEKSLRDRIEQRYGITTWLLSAWSPLEMGYAFEGYRRGGNDLYDAERFMLLSGDGVLLNFGCANPETGALECIFGIETAMGRAIPANAPAYRTAWTEFSYMAQVSDSRGMLKRCAGPITMICHDVTTRWCRLQGHPPMMHLVGRRGWTRVLKSMGIERDELGWITEDQERFRHGIQ